MPITAEDVIEGYKAVLLRNPENDAVIAKSAGSDLS
jgi:hypothetical protein